MNQPFLVRDTVSYSGFDENNSKQMETGPPKGQLKAVCRVALRHSQPVRKAQ